MCCHPAFARATYEPVMAGLPKAVTFGYATPESAGFQAPKNAIEHTPMLDIHMTAVRIARQMRLQLAPLQFGRSVRLISS